MPPVIKKAQRKQVKIKIGISSASGFGKTYSALLLAKGLAGGDLKKVVVIDTENESSSLYSDLGEFSVCPLTAPYSPEAYIEAISLCEKSGFDVIIIDSISHEWDGRGGCLEIVDGLGGQFSVWKKVTPRHNAFIQKIMDANCHIITTSRRKQDYDMVKNDKGKTEPVKVGTKEVTKEGFEYELSIAFELLNANHFCRVSKDRSRLFDGKPEFIITEETGAIIKSWVEQGLSVRTIKMIEFLEKNGVTEQMVLIHCKVNSLSEITEKMNDELAEITSNAKKLSAEVKEPFNATLQRHFKQTENNELGETK